MAEAITATARKKGVHRTGSSGIGAKIAPPKGVFHEGWFCETDPLLHHSPRFDPLQAASLAYLRVGALRPLSLYSSNCDLSSFTISRCLK